jgi:predicted transglutaminase-like cysteine proteinase
MRRLSAIGIIGLGTLFLVSGLRAQELVAIPPEPPADQSSAFMRVYGSTEPPQAFLRFCDEFPEECASTSGIAARPPASAQRLRELDELNTRVNHTIRPEEDLKHYGIADYWTLPADGRGDCEDYALLKRHELIKLGWPSSALLMTIVSDEKGKGHAVLTARTAAGDFILDNKVDEVRLWYRAPYQFLLRQSYLNPRVWMDLDPTRDVAPVSIAGVGPRY